VFAPTEAAFAALTAVPSGQALIDVLTYHVVPAKVPSSALSNGQVVTTVEGSTFTVKPRRLGHHHGRDGGHGRGDRHRRAGEQRRRAVIDGVILPD
jgi:hypothetical protein